MKSFAIEFKIPNVFVQVNDKNLLVPSMMLSTLSVCILVTLVPQLMPLWAAWSTGSRI